MDGATFLQLVVDHFETNPNAIARKAGRPSLQSSVQRFLAGEVESPRKKTLKPAADALGFDVEALFSEAVAAKELKRLGIKLPDGQPVEAPPTPPKPHLDPPAPPASPSGAFDAITADELQLIEDFRFLLDEDKAEYQKQIAKKAASQRAHLGKLWDMYGPKRPEEKK